MIEKHGIEALLEGLKTVDTNEDFYNFIEKKLGVSQRDFTNYIKKAVLSEKC